MTTSGTDLAPFVSVDWLREHLDDVVLVDARWALDGSQTRDDYLAGHLPGAVYVDITEVCSGPAGDGGRHPLPTPEAFAVGLGALGIGDDDTVVAYDQGGAAGAARLVWMLRAIGGDAAVLDGGAAVWDGPFEAGAVERPAASRTPVPWPDDAFVDADGVSDVLTAGRGVVVDARGAARYTGEDEPRDPRGGHLPGAVNVPMTAHLDGDQLRDPDALREEYAAAGALDAEEVVAYCGSGIAASQSLLVLESLGVKGRLYTGSWSDWSADPDRPAATGDAPGIWPS